MKIKIKENIAGNFEGKSVSYTVNQEVDVKKELADDLIKANYAEKITSSRKKKGDE